MNENQREMEKVEILYRRINRWDSNGQLVVPFWCPICERHRSEVGADYPLWVICKECLKEVLF